MAEHHQLPVSHKTCMYTCIYINTLHLHSPFVDLCHFYMRLSPYSFEAEKRAAAENQAHLPGHCCHCHEKGAVRVVILAVAMAEHHQLPVSHKTCMYTCIYINTLHLHSPFVDLCHFYMRLSPYSFEAEKRAAAENQAHLPGHCCHCHEKGAVRVEILVAAMVEHHLLNQLPVLHKMCMCVYMHRVSSSDKNLGWKRDK